MSDSNRATISAKDVVSVLIISLFILSVKLPLLDIPLERDEGEYAYIAWRLPFNELPYRDWFDQKPPAIFWAYRAALLLPIDPIRAIHLTAALFTIGAAAALYFLIRIMLGRTEALFGTAIFALLSVDPLIQGTAANTEVFMQLPILLSHLVFFYGVTKEKQGFYWPFIVGILAGAAAAFKQVAAVNWFLFPLMYPLLGPRGKNDPGSVGFVVSLAAGILAVWAIVGAHFYFNSGFEDMINVVLSYNLGYIQSLPFSVRLKALSETLSTLSGSQAIIWALSVLGLLSLTISREKRIAIYLSAWFAASAIGVSASGYFFPHYFQQILPPLSVLSSVGAAAITRANAWHKIPSFIRASIVFALVASMPLIILGPFIIRYSPEEAVNKIYKGNMFAIMPAVGKRIEELTRPDEKVFIFGADPEVLFYSRRVSATKYIFLFPLYVPRRDAFVKQKETAAEIIKSNPAAIFYLPNNLFYMPGSEQYLTNWVDDYAFRNFRVDTYIAESSGNIKLLRKNKDMITPPPEYKVYGLILVRNDKAAAVYVH